MPSEQVHLEGHIVDSLTMSKVLDLILRHGGTYEIVRFDIGHTRTDVSRAEIVVRADTQARLDAVLHIIGQQGATRDTEDARCAPAPAHGVFPEGFYATTNLVTTVRVAGRWRRVADIEMDCGIVVSGSKTRPAARCVPLHRVRKGDMVVVGDAGVRVAALPRRDPGDVFSFMGSGVSTERPKELVVAATARAMRQALSEGGKVIFVGGPAIVHTGAGRHLADIIRAGWISALFAGNALATHDIEQALHGTSLGVDLCSGEAVANGHEHHLRAINSIRAEGGIRQAVDSGLLTRGIMHACIVTGTPFVLAGSIRDDGPLPDVITDSVKAQEAMRRHVRGATVAIMVATTLHAVATGNLLPASTRTLCVDSDADTVIKLADRGSHQAYGLVTDCEYFLSALAGALSRIHPAQHP